MRQRPFDAHPRRHESRVPCSGTDSFPECLSRLTPSGQSHPASFTPLAPRDKGLCYSLTGSSATEELGERRGPEAVRRDRGKKGKDGEALAELDVLRFLDETDMPAGGGAVVLLRLSVKRAEASARAPPTG
jgi:hypothetical protein